MPLDGSGYTRPSAAVRALTDPAAFRQRFVGQNLPYVTFVADDVMMLRGGELMATLRLGGVDPMTTPDRALDALKHSLAAIVAQAGAAFAWVVHRLPVPQDLSVRPIEATPGPHGADGFAAAVDAAWRGRVGEMGLQSRALFVSVMRRPALGSRIPVLGSLMGGRAFGADRAARMEELHEVMGFLEASLAAARPVRLTRHDGRWLGYLGALISARYHPLGPFARPILIPLCHQIGGSHVSFEGDMVRLTDGATGEERFGAVFGIKSYPPHTDVRVLDGLDLPGDVVLTNSFTPIPRNLMAERIGRTIRQMRSADDAAISIREALVEAADLHETGGMVFGHHHMSLALYCASVGELRWTASQVRRAGQEVGLELVRERMALRATWYAQMPGNLGHRPRQVPISSANFADFAALHGTVEGRPPSASPWGETLTVLPGVRGAGYRVNLHEAGSAKAEPTAGHALVLGRTGSGKTLTVGFLAAQARRAGARVIAFDKDHGMEMALRAMGGRYATIRAGHPTGLAPLMTETDARGRAWLADWLAILLERASPLSPDQTRELARAVDQNAAGEAELRGFPQFISLFTHFDDGGDLEGRLGEWAPGGRYGWVFDRAEGDLARGIDPMAMGAAPMAKGHDPMAMGHDPATAGSEVMGFDMTELLDLQAERTAVLAYLFRRVERLLEDRRPTLLILDEAWQLLNDPYFGRRLENWLVTLRKMNAAVMMLTQHPGQLEASAVGRTIVESVPTMILFPNDRADPADYAMLRLDEKEAALLTAPHTGSRAALIRSAGESVVVDADLSTLGPLLTVLGGGSAGEAFVGPGWRERPDFWRTA